MVEMDTNQELILTLGRVEGKIDAFAQSQVRQETRLDHQDQRLNTLERWQAKVIGVSAAVSAISSAVWQYMIKG